MGLMGPDSETIARGYELVDRHMALQQTTVELLQQIANSNNTGLQTLAITEREVPAGVEVDFPVEGARRWIIPRTATGGSFVIPANLVSVLPANNRRLGGTVVNRGELDVLLILASPENASAQQGLAQVHLRAGGGSWDFRLGSLLWCGSVCAKTLVPGESTLTVAEV